MVLFDSSWRLEAVADMHCRVWSFGVVRTTADLYRPDIFGPTRSFRCECGALVGEAAVDTLCTNCKVFVSGDAAATRRQRIATIELASVCHHPMDKEMIVLDAFPVAPIGFRTERDGSPNALGRKYEILIDVNIALREKLPPKGSEEFFRSMKEHDTSELQAALDDVIGVTSATSGDGVMVIADDTLLGLLFKEIASLGENTRQLAQACGIGMRIGGLL